MSLFALEPEEYTRDLDFHSNYKQSLAVYVSIMRGVHVDTAASRIEELSQPGQPLAPAIPLVEMTYREKAYHDRSIVQVPLDKIMNKVMKENLILGPNMVVYENPKMARSFQGDLIDKNLEDRNRIKKEGQIAKQEKRYDTAVFKHCAQITAKTLNNSMSGAHLSPFNPNFAKSAHTTLTSTCRVGTSSSNSNVEKLILGNRHYYSADITEENIIACIRLSDPVAIQAAMDKHNLNYPTAEYALERIYKCTMMYWQDDARWADIELLIRKLTPIQLAQVMYVNDLKSFIDISPDFTRTMISKCTMHGMELPPLVSVEEADVIINGADSYMESYCGMLSSKVAKGKVIAKTRDREPHIYTEFATRIKYVSETLHYDYLDIIRAFFTTELMPASVYSVPASIRNVVIASDTDSTLFTFQTIIEWYFGERISGYEADCCREFITYFNSQMVVHVLAKVSTHIGVEKKNLFRMKMKPEFSFTSMAVTNRSKHYASLISACEGNVYDEPELETKGVGLKNSSVPGWITTLFNKWLETLLIKFESGEKITPQQAISVVGYLEHHLLDNLRAGNTTSLSRKSIRGPDSYKKPESSVYMMKVFWDEVFGAKYGPMDDVPVSALKLSVNLSSRRKINEWITSLEPAMAARATAFIEKTNKASFTQILVPVDFLKHSPVPDEIMTVFAEDKLLKDVTAGFYYILECLGIYYKNDHNTRFVYREHSKTELKENLLFEIDDMLQ